MKKIDLTLIEQTTAKAKESPRQRMNFNFHTTPGDPLHRMLNAMEPGTYIAPHKHESPDKREAFIILRGRVLIVVFNEKGAVTAHTVLEASGETMGAEIPPRTYHTLVSLQPGSVIYEVKDGPWDPHSDKHFAPWAPIEGEPGAMEYQQRLLEQLGVA